MALPAHRVIGHKEYGNRPPGGTPGRKTDPIYNMDWRRQRVASFTPRGAAAPVAEPPKPVETEYKDMNVIQNSERGIAVLGANYYRHCRTDQDVYDAVALHGAAKIADNPEQFDRWVAQAFASDISPVGELKDFIRAEVAQVAANVRAALVEGYGVKLEPKEESPADPR